MTGGETPPDGCLQCSSHTVVRVSSELEDFSRYMAALPSDLNDEQFEHLWLTADRVTVARLARRPDLPHKFHELAANHVESWVRAGYADNPVAEPDLLESIAKTETETSVMQSLLRNDRTPGDALIPSVKENREFSLLALYRKEGSSNLRRNAAATFAAYADVNGLTASKQIVDLFGPYPEIYVAALPRTPAAGLAIISAAVQSCIEHEDLQVAVVDWVDTHHHVIVRDDHVELSRTLVAFATHPSVELRHRRWALNYLKSSDERSGVEALIAWECGQLPEMVRMPHQVIEALTHLMHLRQRIADTELAPMLADSVRLVSEMEESDLVGLAVKLLRNQYNPSLGRVLDLLATTADLAARRFIIGQCGVAALDHVEDIWAVLDGVDLPTAEIAKIRSVRLNPNDALNRLAPLQQLLEAGTEFSSPAVERINQLGFGTTRWRTAAVLAPNWQGTLPELLETADLL
jgi:hypothetical protein